MHLSQAESHAVISVESYERKSITFRRPHSKAITLSALFFILLLPSPFPLFIKIQSCMISYLSFVNSVPLSTSSSEAIQGIQSVSKPDCRDGGIGTSHRLLGLLTGSDCLGGSLCSLQSPAQCLHRNCVLVFRKTLLSVS